MTAFCLRNFSQGTAVIVLLTVVLLAPLKGQETGDATPSENSAGTAAVISQGIAGEQIKTSIQELGDQPEIKEIASLVFKAVKHSPDDVLTIVRSAILASPEPAVPAIIAAAISALPRPWKEILYLGPGVFAVLDSTNHDAGSTGEGGRIMTLVEAVLQTAMDTIAGLNLESLQRIAEIALKGDPQRMLWAINDPHFVSGVGFTGINNYSNEPYLSTNVLRARGGSQEPKEPDDPTPPPPEKPVPPPVSL